MRVYTFDLCVSRTFQVFEKAVSQSSAVLLEANTSLACAGIILFNSGFYINTTLYTVASYDISAAVNFLSLNISNSNFRLSLNQGVVLIAKPLINLYTPPTTTTVTTTTVVTTPGQILIYSTPFTLSLSSIIEQVFFVLIIIICTFIYIYIYAYICIYVYMYAYIYIYIYIYIHIHVCVCEFIYIYIYIYMYMYIYIHTCIHVSYCVPPIISTVYLPSYRLCTSHHIDLSMHFSMSTR